jgi:hypothetical protein
MNSGLIAIEQVIDPIDQDSIISQLYFMIMMMDYIDHSLIRLVAIVTGVEY